MSLFNIREGVPEDVPFVCNSFLKRYREAVSPRLISDAQYYKFQHAVVQKILAGDNARLAVAVDPQDPGQIFGYLLHEDITSDWKLLHFLYVKSPFRKFGVATALLNYAVTPQYNKIHYSHRTELVKYLDPQQQAVFNPAYVWSIL